MYLKLTKKNAVTQHDGHQRQTLCSFDCGNFTYEDLSYLHVTEVNVHNLLCDPTPAACQCH